MLNVIGLYYLNFFTQVYCFLLQESLDIETFAQLFF
jgi:hypothetical protein